MAGEKISAERASIFEEEGIDVAAFAPKADAPAGPSLEQLEPMTRTGRFRSREAVPAADQAEAGQGARHRRRRHLIRTGRNQTFSVRGTEAYIDRFYDLAERANLKPVEAFERAVDAWQRELDGAP
jgi:hypothetical protein